MDLENFYLKHKKSCRDGLLDYAHLIPDNAIVFDIGSNMGMYSEGLLEIKPDVFIHMFEPVKKYYEISSEKFKEKNERVVINNVGLSNKEEIKNIFVDTERNNNNPGWNTYISEQTQSNMDSQQTVMTTLDNYCSKKNIKHIDFIKIDTEGYEAFVLEGFLNTLKKLEKKPYLFIELGWGNRHPNWEFSRKIFVELKSIGYKFRNLDNIRRTTDILFEPPN